MGEKPSATASLEQALGFAEAADDTPLTSLALTQVAICAGAVGRRPEALKGLDRAFSIARSDRLTLAKGHALGTVACLEVQAAPPIKGEGRETPPVRALEMLGRAQLLDERTGDVASLGRTYNNFGVLHYLRSNFVNAIPFFERSLELLGETGDILALLAVLNNSVRAVEQESGARAGALRDKTEELAAVLHDGDLPRFGDLTAWFTRPVGRMSSDATFAGELYIGDPVLLAPVLFSWHIAA